MKITYNLAKRNEELENIAKKKKPTKKHGGKNKKVWYTSNKIPIGEIRENGVKVNTVKLQNTKNMVKQEKRLKNKN